MSSMGLGDERIKNIMIYISAETLVTLSLFEKYFLFGHR